MLSPRDLISLVCEREREREGDIMSKAGLRSSRQQGNHSMIDLFSSVSAATFSFHHPTTVCTHQEWWDRAPSPRRSLPGSRGEMHSVCPRVCLHSPQFHNLQELRHSASLANKVFIQRDYSEGTTCKFQTKFPSELESRVRVQTRDGRLENDEISAVVCPPLCRM